jgi:threonine synthase
MLYYSTNKTAPLAALRKAVTQGLAEDRGLYMPEKINRLPADFFKRFHQLNFQDIACNVADAFFGEDIETEALRRIVKETLSFPCPVVEVEPNIYSLELFHGPTLAFKDVGARFMARLLQHFRKGSDTVNVLVATSGDTGSAVANGFLGVEGIQVYVLYPKGKVSPIQECQFTTLGRNITAIEVDGVFDDCQRLVKQAFMDQDLRQQLTLTSANSINVARFLPQAFYYFNAVAQVNARFAPDFPEIVISVPSGNFGNLTAALFGQQMGLPVKRFIAANNANDIVFNYLKTGLYQPKESVQTIANAMDVGDPSNFARIADLYGSWDEVKRHISGATYSDDEIRATMRRCYEQTGYVLDPHGACGYQALKDGLQPGEVGVFCETAHPAKFKTVVEEAIGHEVPIPDRLAAFMQGQKQSVPLRNDYGDFRSLLLNTNK